MSEIPTTFDPGPEFRDDVRRARARVAAMRPDVAKALLLEAIESFPGLVLASEERRSCLLRYRRGPDELES